MVELLRIDERLIHGQVAVSWNQQISPDAIVVINNEVVKDEMQKMAIKMAKPLNVKLAIKSVDEGIELLNNPKTANMKLFVVVRSTTDALQVMENIKGIKMINAGGMTKKSENSLQIDSYLYVTENDIENFKKMKQYADMIDCRIVPADKKTDILNS